MKRTIVIAVVAAASFLLGWFAHTVVFAIANPPGGIQWQFSDAASCGDVGRLQELFKRGAKVDDVPLTDGVQGYTALFRAANAGEADAVRWLLEHGADPNHDTSDANPLGFAQRRVDQATKAAELLKTHGAK